MADKIGLQPLGGNILVKPEELETTTPSGIVISSTNKGEKPERGKVVALGTGKVDSEGKDVPFNVEVGDEVLFKKYAPDEVEVDGESYLIMEESDILAVVK